MYIRKEKQITNLFKTHSKEKRIQMAMLANFGAEFRTEKNGAFI